MQCRRPDPQLGGDLPERAALGSKFTSAIEIDPGPGPSEPRPLAASAVEAQLGPLDEPSALLLGDPGEDGYEEGAHW